MRDARDRIRVVVAGGGVAGLETLVGLRARAGDRVESHLVSPQAMFALRALGVDEHFGRGHPKAYALASIAGDLDVVLHHDAVHLVRGEEHSVQLQSGAELPFDVLVLAVGAFAFPAFKHGVCLADTHDGVDDVIGDLRAGRARRLAVVVPTGVDWTLPGYEFALSAAAEAPGPQVTLVTHELAPLERFGAPAVAMIRAELAAAGIDLLSGIAAEVPGDGVVDLGPGARVEADHVVHLPLLAGPRLRGTASDPDGFLRVDTELRAGHADVYAAGDCCVGTPKQGGLAAQQADAVVATIAARAGAGVHAEPFHPILRGLLRTARGPRYLRAEGDECLVSEQPLWWPPSKVASHWLVPWLATRDLERAAG